MNRIVILLFTLLLLLFISCSSNKIAVKKEQPPKKSESKEVVNVDKEASNVQKILAEVELLYSEGEKYMKAQHLNKARDSFDKAIAKLLWARSEYPNNEKLLRILNDIVNNIHNYEMDALEGGDVFSEEEIEPALIDELKDIPYFPPSREMLQKEKQYLAEAKELSFDIPIVINDNVLAMIEAFQNERRKEFVRGLNRAGLYIDLIRKILEEEGVPRDLVYAALIESGFNPKAYSVAKAKGIWQFIQSTGRRYGLEVNWWIDERSDPIKSTRAAAAYLKDLYNMFGDWYLALAAYNAGERKIQNAIEKVGKKDFWAIAKTNYIKDQTRNYVPAIIAAAIICRDPEKSGFPPIIPKPLEYDTIEITRYMDLRTIADYCDCSKEDLLTLNPELRRNIVPGSLYNSYNLRIPKGKKEILAGKLDNIPSYKAANLRNYIVRKGDTLYKIASRYGINVNSLAEANGLSTKSILKPGLSIIIPTGKTYYSYARKLKDKKIPSGADYVVVKQGDTLYSISSRYGIELSKLKSINKLTGNDIYPGQKLLLSDKQPKIASNNNNKKTIYYKVKAGDTLYKISQKHGVSIDSICNWNNIDRKVKLYPGDTLTIYSEQ